MHQMVTAAVGDRANFNLWFGSYATQRKYPDLDQQPARALTAAQIERRLARGRSLSRHPASRYAFMRRGRGCVLFVDGAAFPCAGATVRLAERLCGRADRVLGASAVRARAALALVTALYAQGSLVFDDGL